MSRVASGLKVDGDLKVWTAAQITSAGVVSAANGFDGYLKKNVLWRNSGQGGVQYFDGDFGSASLSANQYNTDNWDGPTNAWYQVLHMPLSVSGYFNDIAVPVNDINGIYWRQRRSSTFYNWMKLLDTNNYQSTIASSALSATTLYEGGVGLSSKYAGFDTYTFQETTAASWHKLGTITTIQAGAITHLKIISHAGYNAQISQNQVTEVYFKTSNASSNQSGFYGDGNAFRNRELGGSTSSPSSIRIVQNSQTSYSFYVYMGAFTSKSVYTVKNPTGTTWAHDGTYTSAAPTGTYIDVTPTDVWGDTYHPTTLTGYGVSSGDTLFDSKYAPYNVFDTVQSTSANWIKKYTYSHGSNGQYYTKVASLTATAAYATYSQIFNIANRRGSYSLHVRFETGVSSSAVGAEYAASFATEDYDAWRITRSISTNAIWEIWFKTREYASLSEMSLGVGYNSSFTASYTNTYTSADPGSQVGVRYVGPTSIDTWNTAYTSAHFHTNKTNLDLINQNLNSSASPTFASLSIVSATNKGYITFGNDTNKFGYDGSRLSYGGDISLSGDTYYRNGTGTNFCATVNPTSVRASIYASSDTNLSIYDNVLASSIIDIGIGALKDIKLNKRLRLKDGMAYQTYSSAIDISTQPDVAIFQTMSTDYWMLYGENLSTDNGRCILELGDNGDEEFRIGWRPYQTSARTDYYWFRSNLLYAPTVSARFYTLDVDLISSCLINSLTATNIYLNSTLDCRTYNNVNSTKEQIKFQIGQFEFANNSGGTVTGEVWTGGNTTATSAPSIFIGPTKGQIAYGSLPATLNGDYSNPYIQWDSTGLGLYIYQNTVQFYSTVITATTVLSTYATSIIISANGTIDITLPQNGPVGQIYEFHVINDSSVVRLGTYTNDYIYFTDSSFGANNYVGGGTNNKPRLRNGSHKVTCVKNTGSIYFWSLDGVHPIT